MQKKKYTPLPASYLYEVPKPLMLIEGIMPRGGLVGVSGAPGTGKSWFMLEMCRALATGTKFLGKFDVQQTSTLFVGSDSSEFDYATCWKRLTLKQYEALGGRDADVDSDGEDVGDYNVLSDRVRFLIQSDFSFDDEEKVEALARAINYEWGWPELVPEHEGEDEDGLPYTVPEQWDQERGAGLIVIDTFGSVTDYDLIDNSMMIQVYRRIRSLVEKTGATVVLLHHNPHGRDSWLGAISQVGKLDAWIQLGRTSTMPPDMLQARFKKFRGIKPEPIFYRMNVNDPNEASLVACANPAKPVGPTVDEVGTEKDPDWQLTLDLLGGGPQSTSSICRYKQGSFSRAKSDDAAKKVIQRLLPKMAEAGVIRCVEKGAGSSPDMWALASTNGASGT